MPERDCSSCTRQVEWGCHAHKHKEMPDEGMDVGTCWTNPAAIPVTLLGQDTYACPRQHVREHPGWWGRLISLRAAYDKGILPDSGGFMDQSAPGMRAIQIVDAVYAEAMDEKSKKDYG